MIFDKSVLPALLSSDEWAVLQTFYDLVLGELRSLQKELRETPRPQDPVLWRDRIHPVKSSCMSTGALAAGDMLEKIELALADGHSVASLTPDLSALSQTCEKTIAAIENHVKTQS
ncbi:hypothetical protein [Congregibacter sp.]|uniref:hypothetical protein n=1 Tax=Congregibacter sp. TaxID=2744308 RepID=UPI003F6B9006